MNALKVVWGICLGALCGAGIEGVGEDIKVLTVAVAGALTGILSLIIGLDYIFKKVWPNKLDWEFSTSNSIYPAKVFDDRGHVYWRSSTPQEDGMYYKLDLRKERVISGIHFSQGNNNNVPQRWTITFHDSMNRILVPNKDGTKPLITGVDSILVYEIERPIKARYVTIKITEPRTDENGNAYYWHIEDIFIRENKLGHYLRRVVC